MPTKTFSVCAVYSVATSALCCPIGDLYDILNHLTGDNLFTHALPRAARFASPLVRAMFPALPESIDLTGIKEASDPWAFVRAAVEVDATSRGLPSTFDLPTLPGWTPMDPFHELAAICSPSH